VSAFTSAKIDKIVASEPDLVLGFSDLQADIAAELIRAGSRCTSSTTAALRRSCA
jgi:iron complex transport system substrate-binding protein